MEYNDENLKEALYIIETYQWQERSNFFTASDALGPLKYILNRRRADLKTQRQIVLMAECISEDQEVIDFIDQ